MNKYPEPQPKTPQYPADYNPPFRGVCEDCGIETRGATKEWLHKCPYHWAKLRKEA